MAQYEEVTAGQVKALLVSCDPILLDIRDSHSYRDGHIEGAMLSHDGLMDTLIRKREYDRPLIIYCYHGTSSRDLAEFFSTLGFKQVYSMRGGYLAWQKQAQI